jgi:hypothetical protein
MIGHPPSGWVCPSIYVVCIFVKQFFLFFLGSGFSSAASVQSGITGTIAGFCHSLIQVAKEADPSRGGVCAEPCQGLLQAVASEA